MKGIRLKIQPPGCSLLKATVGIADPPTAPAAGGKVARHLMMVERGQRELLEIIRALLRRADSRAAWIAGNNSATRMPMIAMTTNSSTNVKPSLTLSLLMIPSFMREKLYGIGHFLIRVIRDAFHFSRADSEF